MQFIYLFFKTQRVAFYFFHFGRANALDRRTLLNRMEVEGACTSVVFIFQAVPLMPFITKVIGTLLSFLST